MPTQSPPDLPGASGISSLTRLNVVSLLAQAGYNLKEGNTERAALLFGAAALAPQSSGLSYAIQGGLFARDLLSKLTESPEPPADATEIPIN